MEDIKVIQVMKKILSNLEEITSTFKYEDEIYFIFRSRFFSVLFGSTRDGKFGPYTFYVYPKWRDTNLGNLAEASTVGPDGAEMVAFHSAQYPEPESQQVFRDLYSRLQRKNSKIDEIFDEILADF